MAFTITKNKIGVAGDLRYVIGSLAFDSSYATGGEAFAPADVGLSKFHDVRIHGTAGYTFAFDYTNNKVLAYVGMAEHNHALSLSGAPTSASSTVLAGGGYLGASIGITVAGVSSTSTTVGGVVSQAATAGAQVASGTDLSSALSSVAFMAWGV